MPLHELLGWPGPLTSRQLAAWEAWFDLQLDRPCRPTDVLLVNYLMQLAAETRRTPGRVWGREPSVEMENLRLVFNRSSVKPRFRSREEAAMVSKAVWAARKEAGLAKLKAQMGTQEQRLAAEVRKAIMADRAGGPRIEED